MSKAAAFAGARCRVSGLGVLFAGALALAGLGGAGRALANVSVSASGTPGYSYPVAVPPGIAGMAPNLSISYSGGGVNGPVGHGWSVQGVSSITRCPSSKLIDGVARTVEFNASDRLCLDGQRLVRIDPTNTSYPPHADQANDAAGLSGTAFAEYRTEKDSFARIRAYGAWAGNIANGPQYFKVWTKSGQVSEYGNYEYANPQSTTQDAVVAANGFTTTTPVAVWAVKRIADVAGNYMAFAYSQRDTAWGTGPAVGTGPFAPALGREWSIEEIRYTGNGSQAPANKVVFAYSDRPTNLDKAEAYQLKNKNVSIRRLDAIRTYVNWPAWGTAQVPSTAVKVRTVKITYNLGAISGRSRVAAIEECAGNTESPCLPGPTFNYASGSAPTYAANAAFASSSLATLKMLDTGGNFGILTGDFNGDGLTDILRWGNSPSGNELHFSNGNGTFTKYTSTALSSINFFKTDGCFTSMVADFNGDGLSDVLRIAKAGCSPNANVLYLASASGAAPGFLGFAAMVLPSTIDLETLKANKTSRSYTCTMIQGGGGLLATQGGAPVEGIKSSTYAAPEAETFDKKLARSAINPAKQRDGVGGLSPTVGSTCWSYSRSLGKSFSILDMNGDGVLDILTSVAPPYSNWRVAEIGPLPTEAELCQGQAAQNNYIGYCSRVFKGNGDGTFAEVTASSLIRNSSLYIEPPAAPRSSNPYWRLPNQADINGDGLQDILATFSGGWRSTGDFSFVTSTIQDGSQICSMPVDSNGDGRAECLIPDATASNQKLALTYGALYSAPIAQFNLTQPADALYGQDTSFRQTVGVLVDDFDGDGRQDLLRWGPTPGTDNGIYLANGDGSFRIPRVSAGLQAITRPLQSADGTTSFVTGDFLGLGTLQLLHLKHNPAATGDVVANTNQLYQRPDTPPLDRLESVRSPSGLTTTLTYARLTSDAPGTPTHQRRYVSDREAGTPSSYPLVDLRPPVPIIIRMETPTASAAGGMHTVEYAYRGMRAGLDGRGMLGFRQSVQQTTAGNGEPLSVWTSYLHQTPYQGVAHRTETRRGAWTAPNAPLLSQTLSTYCDKTSSTLPAAATEQLPCATTAKISRPFLYKTEETGTDLDGSAMPTVVTKNEYNNFGDPLKIDVTTTATLAGEQRQYLRQTLNDFCDPGSSANCPNKISDTQWILGRLVKSTVTNTVPDLRAALTASAGSAPHATAVVGTPPPAAPPTPLSAAQLAAILQLLLED